MSNIHAALEIGTSRTVLAVGEADANGRLKITCHAEIPSAGVRKSQILDIPQVTQSIRSVIHEAEKAQEGAESSVSIGNAFLVVSGQHIKADPFSASVQVANSRVDEEAMDEVMRAAHLMTLTNDRELLDIVDLDYELDNLRGIASPKGMSGRILKLNTLQIHADRNSIQNARTAAEAVHLEIRDPLFAATCAADAVLDEREKHDGVLVLDLGGGSTGYAAYSDGFAVATGVIGVGGDHVTNDIAHAFQTTNAQAEGLKTREACATLSTEAGESVRVRVDTSENTLMDNRTVSRHALNTVVNARLMELLTVIRETLEEQDLLHRLHAGVVLTGGGAQMRHIDALVHQTLGMNVRIGRPIGVDGLDDVAFPASFAAISGALIYAHRNYEEHSLLDGILGRFFK